MRAYWDSLSRREQNLAMLTVGLVAIGVVAMVGYRAVETIDRLDGRIAQLEQELVNLREQEAASASAEVAFQEMAAEHSSAWTAEEIQDRLRNEIYRLALKNENIKNPKQRDYMVRIPRLREGTLIDTDEGYREYKLELQLEPAHVMDVMRFLERLQKSKQSLRIDFLHLARNPSHRKVSTAMEITRTVLDSDPDAVIEGPMEESFFAGGDFENWVTDGPPEGWVAENCEVFRNESRATEGRQCLEAAATGKAGILYAKQSLPGGQSYKLEFDVTAEGPVVAGVRDPANPKAMNGSRRIEGNGEVYRCELWFTPSGVEGEPSEVFAPHLQLEDGGKVYVDNVRLTLLES